MVARRGKKEEMMDLREEESFKGLLWNPWKMLLVMEGREQRLKRSKGREERSRDMIWDLSKGGTSESCIERSRP